MCCSSDRPASAKTMLAIALGHAAVDAANRLAKVHASWDCNGNGSGELHARWSIPHRNRNYHALLAVFDGLWFNDAHAERSRVAVQGGT